MSVAVGVGQVLQHARRKQSMHLSSDDQLTVQHFVENPGSFATGGMSAAQTGQNPFGDYAPQSTQIQGILKGMYDAFTADLEKDNVEEANKQKSFEELMATKKQELDTLEATLEKQTADDAAAKDLLAKTTSDQETTKEQLAADEIFFADTKAACK